MKRVAFRVHPDRAGWLRTTLCPINQKNEATFGFIDVIMFGALVLGTVAAARLLLAN